MADYVAKGQKWDLLDHGYIKLIDFMGSDEGIVEAARMSTGKSFQGWEPGERCRHCGWREDSKKFEYDGFLKSKCDQNGAHHVMEKVPGDAALLDYLWRHLHTSPFEFGEIHIEVLAPVLVWRQWMRHRTQSYNEASARYTQMPNLHYLPSPERIQAQGKKNKQGSEGRVDPLAVKHFLETCKLQQDQVYESYEMFISEDGIANETARLNSPVSRYSKARVKTDLLNWFRFLALRMEEHAQWETRQYANCIGNEIVAKLFPRSWAVFQEHTLFGARLSRTEMSVIQDILLAWQQNMPSTDILRGEAEDHGLKGSALDEFLTKVRKAGQG